MVNLEPGFEKRLARKVEELSTTSILETLPNGVILLDEKGLPIFANSRFTSLTGYKLNELIGLSPSEIISTLVAGEVPGLEQETFNYNSDGEPFSLRQRLRHKNGHVVPLDIKGYPIKEEDGETRGLMLCCKDLGSELMLKVTGIINSSLQLKDVLRNTTLAVVEYLGLSSTAIFLLDKTENLLKLTACNVFSAADLPKVVIPVGEGAPGLIAQERKAIYVENLTDSPLIDEVAKAIHFPKSSIGYPLLCQGELLGVIAFDADTIREFSDKEQELFESIAGQVALAIYNAQLFARLEHLSITDGLTGLYNHRYFQERLLEEISRAKRSKGYFSLLMLDIDHFKNYNDNFGHPLGDELLKSFSKVIKENLRNFDVACRYGGEEFAVILPNCTMSEAYQIAERIRINCENYSFWGREKQPGGNVTVSVGVSSYPEASTTQELITFADRALYEAKNLNRNRVYCHRQ